MSKTQYNMKKLKTFTLLLIIAIVAPMFVHGQYALNFDGVDDYVDCGTNPELNITGDITIELWIYLTGPMTIFDRLVEKDWSSSYFFGGKYGLNGLAFSMDANNNSSNVVETATNIISQNVWTHVAATWDGSTMRIYINGEEEASKAWTNTVDGSTNSTKLGRYYGVDDNYFKGYMDEVRIWSEALTAEQLRENMYKPLDDPETEANLVAYYQFEEGSGQETNDNSQYSNTGVLGGTSSPESSDPLWVSSTAPIPFYSVSDGNWTNPATWASGQNYPVKNWSRVNIAHDITADANFGTIDMTLESNGNLDISTGISGSFGDLTIQNNASVTLNANSIMAINENGDVTVEAGGTFNSFGISGNEASVTHNTGYYSFFVDAGGEIAAANTDFEFMDINGISISGDIDESYPFQSCSFANGIAGGTLITIGNSQDITLEELNFPANTWSGTYNISKTFDAGQVDVSDATGDFAGETYENDPYGRVNWGGRTLDVKVYLEGAYNGTSLKVGLTGDMPLGQPFSGAPWNYSGSESVVSIPVNVVDWALIEYRDATDAASANAATAVHQEAVFIDSDGNLVGLDGSSPISVSTTFTNNFYLVIIHRNHIDIMSGNALTLTGAAYEYDFTTGAGQAYGDGDGYKEITSGIYGMISGDSNGDGTIDANDKTNSWENEAGTTGYLSSDLNLDGNSSNQDKNEFWLININKYSQVPN